MSKITEKYHDGPRSSSESSTLDLEAEQPLLETMRSRKTGFGQKSSGTRGIIWMTAAHALMFVASIMFFISGQGKTKMSDQECATQLSAYSPAVGAIEYEYVRFQGSLLDENPYKGPPSVERDVEWSRIANLAQIRVGADDLHALDKPLTQAAYPEEVGGGYTAGLEVFHQLHCLNILRQWTYKEYYLNPEVIPDSFTDSNHTLRLHLDHCIDMIRQVLMCQGDVGIVTSSWVDGFNSPYPDFNVWHKCRKFEPLMQYTAEHQVEADITPPTGARILPRPPCEKASQDEQCP